MYNQESAPWSVWTAPLVELQQINQKASEKIVRECISFFSENAATSVKMMQNMPQMTNTEDFVSVQMKAFTQQGEKTLEFIQNIFKIYQDVMKEQCQWTKEKVSTAVSADFGSMNKRKSEA